MVLREQEECAGTLLGQLQNKPKDQDQSHFKILHHYNYVLFKQKNYKNSGEAEITRFTKNS